jgi:hypothetical protein
MIGARGEGLVSGVTDRLQLEVFVFLCLSATIAAQVLQSLDAEALHRFLGAMHPAPAFALVSAFGIACLWTLLRLGDFPFTGAPQFGR